MTYEDFRLFALAIFGIVASVESGRRYGWGTAVLLLGIYLNGVWLVHETVPQ
jgi:hypothetical protein